MIRYYSGGPNEHVLVYRNGRLARGGPGLRCLVTPGSRLAIVPRTASEAKLAFSARSSDRHRVRVEGDLMFRVTAPAKAAAVFDFVVGPREEDDEDGLARLSKSVAAVARDILRDEISHMPAERLLAAEAALGRTTLIRLRHSPVLREFGVQPVSVFIKDIRMPPEVLDSLEAEAIEAVKMRAVVSSGAMPSFPEPPPPDGEDYTVTDEDGLRRTECTDDCPFRHLCDDYQRNRSDGKAWCTLFREFTT